MESQDVYGSLAKMLMMEHSEIIRRIWRVLCTEEEAKMVASLPATCEDLAGRFSRDVAEVQALLDRLFRKGVVFEYTKDGKTFYRGPRHIVQFHDATIAWPDAPEELFSLWREFAETEYPLLLELVTSIKMPSFMRVIPVGETVEPKTRVLSFEDAKSMIEAASCLAVTACVCRKLMRRCDGPLEVCLQLNRSAEYTLKRGTGRPVSASEALGILEIATKAGLVHLTENKSGPNNVICNCCRCCCEMLRFAGHEKTKGVLAPSRFQAMIRDDVCTGCMLCAQTCPMGAIEEDDKGLARVNAHACIGCGLCAGACPVSAACLVEVRPESFIPS